MNARFLNVDLEIWSSSKLDSLVHEMGGKLVVLYSGPWPGPKQHSLSLENSKYYQGPDASIHALCSAVEGLSAKERRLWAAARKQFDVGYELRAAERSSLFALRPDTLQRVAASPQPGTELRTMTWDEWNRLVSVSSGTTPAASDKPVSDKHVSTRLSHKPLARTFSNKLTSNKHSNPSTIYSSAPPATMKLSSIEGDVFVESEDPPNK
jgi:hypothetical protein